MRTLTVAIVAIAALQSAFICDAMGHGAGSEVTPPFTLGDSTVSLEILSSQEDGVTRIQFALIDVNSKVTVRDVTYDITATKGGGQLFSQAFEARDGILVFLMEGGETEEITITREKAGGFFESIVGLEEERIRVKGSPLATGGLYRFEIGMSNPGTATPVLLDAGISVPERTPFEIHDPDLGVQRMEVITYYDEIASFGYDRDRREISLVMPFEWSTEAINQTVTVHEEFILEKTFADLLVSGYVLEVNGVEMPERTVVVDDYSKDRTIHVVLLRDDLYHILEEQGPLGDEIVLILAPREGATLGMATENGQFMITLDWEPEHLKSGSETEFFFNITDVFLRGARVAVEYDLDLIQEGRVITSVEGVSSDSGGEGGRFAVFIPGDMTGPALIRFSNLGGNTLAAADLPVIIDRSGNGEIAIPDWIKRSAGWWVEGKVSDSEFASGIGYMISEGILRVPVPDKAGDMEDAIPDWIRRSTGWWVEGKVSDSEFASGIGYLVANGIIRV